MRQRLLASGWAIAIAAAAASPLGAQAEGAAWARDPGGYLSWWKLIAVVVVFVSWVRMADWMNVDAQQYSARTRIAAEPWNLLVVGTFLGGLLAVLLVPFFFAGFPFYLLAAWGPFIAYVVLRNNRVPEHLRVFTGRHLKAKVGREQPLVDVESAEDEGPRIRIEPSGNEHQGQANLIRARQTGAYVILKEILSGALATRADCLTIVRTARGAQWRQRIDGVWHPLPEMDAAAAEAATLCLKFVSNIDPAQRVARLRGGFAAKSEVGSMRCETEVSRDAQSETLVVKVAEAKRPPMSLAELGMFPDDARHLLEALNAPGLVIVSAPPGVGLSTTWQSVLHSTDRVTKDWVGILEASESESRLENIEQVTYDLSKGVRPTDLLRSMLLKQPNAFVVPKFEDAALLDAMTEQVMREGRIVVTRIHARSAAEALLRVMKIAGERERFVDAVTAVIGQQLARRLCGKCRQPMPAAPALIQKLGGDPRKVATLYQQYRPPNPPPVDKKGRPIEIPPCTRCAGVGYYGRVALVELLLVDEPVKKLLRTRPDLESLTQAGLVRRGKSALQQGYRHVLAGTTSLAEIQRVFKPAPQPAGKR